MSKSNGQVAIRSGWAQVDGHQLVELAEAGLFWLEVHVEQVNALNVFPVPDGDTGTNMLWTMRAACSRANGARAQAAGDSASFLARGALLGARGNSGVILSQFWQGLARGLQGKAVLDPAGLAQALNQAREAAYAAVAQPVEGTILTVIRAAAAAANRAGRRADLRSALEAVVHEAASALARTPEMLPVLKQAGVVDSGGQGLLFIFEGMVRHMHGLSSAEGKAIMPGVGPRQTGARPGEQLPYPYDVQFRVDAATTDLAAVRERIEAMGDSALVVGDGHTIKVHVHVVNPGMPLAYGASLGWLEDVVVENMQAQVDAREAAVPAVVGELHASRVAVIAVAAGAGLVELFRQLGATVVDGGQSNNPGVESVLQAVEAAPAESVIILPNNKNVIMAAEAAAAMAAKTVKVVPTHTLPQGIAAMLAFRADGEPEQVAEGMARAGSRVLSGAITTATRTVSLDGVDVAEGQHLALADGRLCAAGDSVDDLLPPLLAALALERRELLSLYYGEGIVAAEAGDVADAIRRLYPAVDVEVIAGGTPHYHYLLGSE